MTFRVIYLSVGILPYPCYPTPVEPPTVLFATITFYDTLILEPPLDCGTKCTVAQDSYLDVSAKFQWHVS